MAVKKYYLDNGEYGTSEFNKMVGYLRTTGVYGEIENCLKVSYNGLNAIIANGIGWVDGVAIEASESNNTVTLPSTAGNYSIIMKLEKTGDTVNDISFAYVSGQISGNHVLAWVGVSGGVITTVTDRRVNSTFNGTTQILTGTANWEAGDKVLFADYGTVKSLINPTYTKACEYRMGNSGIVRIGFGLSIMFSEANTAYAKIYKNDVAVGIERSTSSKTPVAYTEDISVTAGDKISIYTKRSSAGYDSDYASISSVTFSISRGSDIIQIV